MRRHAIGVAGGVLAFLGSALAAEAQINIDGHKPTTVYHSDSQSTYEATVTWTGTFTFKLWVYYDNVLKYTSPQYNYSSPGTLNVSHVVTGMNTWGMVAGHQLKYRAKVWSGLIYDLDDHFVTVSQGTSRVQPGKSAPFVPAREELFAVVTRREERELA